MRIRPILFLASLVLATPALAQEDAGHATEHRWIADFDQAVTIAKKEGKDLLVDFTGSDWCGWCIRLHNEVFQYDSFYNPVSKKFVLVSLDFPNSEEVKAKVPNPKRNAELAQKYQIGGYPTILLMTADGEVYAQTGYQEGGPEKYVAHVKEITESGKKILAEAKLLVTEFDNAKDKTMVVRKAIQILGDAKGESPAVPIVAGVVRKAFDLDPDNAAGLKLDALTALFASSQAAAKEFDMAFAMDPKNAKGLYEQAVVALMYTVRDAKSANQGVDALLKLKSLGKVHEAATIKDMVVRAAKWCEAEQMLNRKDDAHTLATWAKALGELNEQEKELLKDIL